MGEFDLDLYHNKALKLILALFIFIVVIVLLNVLIAIVSNSHDAITGKIAAGLFYRSRLEYIAEVTPIVESSCFEAIVERLKLIPMEDKYTIKKRLKDALEDYKDDVAEDDSDAARLAAIRESEERAKKDLAAMEAKVDKLADMLQKVLDDKKKSGSGQ